MKISHTSSASVDCRRDGPSESQKNLGASVCTALAAIFISLIMALPW